MLTLTSTLTLATLWEHLSFLHIGAKCGKKKSIFISASLAPICRSYLSQDIVASSQLHEISFTFSWPLFNSHTHTPPLLSLTSIYSKSPLAAFLFSNLMKQSLSYFAMQSWVKCGCCNVNQGCTSGSHLH